MSFWNRLVCLVKGHKSSLFPGIGAPAAFQWTFPGEAPPPPLVKVSAPSAPAISGMIQSGLGGNIGIVGPSKGSTGIHAVGGAGYGIPSHTGPTFNLDLCPRCLTLFAAKPPPTCENCGLEKGLHDDFCDLPCQNCGKPKEAHDGGKCLFEASEYKGARWVESTRSGCL